MTSLLSFAHVDTGSAFHNSHKATVGNSATESRKIGGSFRRILDIMTSLASDIALESRCL
jgi:hypothetical protein